MGADDADALEIVVDVRQQEPVLVAAQAWNRAGSGCPAQPAIQLAGQRRSIGKLLQQRVFQLPQQAADAQQHLQRSHGTLPCLHAFVVAHLQANQLIEEGAGGEPRQRRERNRGHRHHQAGEQRPGIAGPFWHRRQGLPEEQPGDVGIGAAQRATGADHLVELRRLAYQRAQARSEGGAARIVQTIGEALMQHLLAKDAHLPGQHYEIRLEQQAAPGVCVHRCRGAVMRDAVQFGDIAGDEWIIDRFGVGDLRQSAKLNNQQYEESGHFFQIRRHTTFHAAPRCGDRLAFCKYCTSEGSRAIEKAGRKKARTGRADQKRQRRIAGTDQASARLARRSAGSWPSGRASSQASRFAAASAARTGSLACRERRSRSRAAVRATARRVNAGQASRSARGCAPPRRPARSAAPFH